MGGGVIGVEFATIFQALCSKVTIVEKGPHLLGPMDEEVSEALKEQLVKKGITVYCNAMVEGNPAGGRSGMYRAPSADR